MSRPLRIEYAGAWYHVMNRSRLREKIFITSRDYERFLAVLKEAAGTFHLRVAAFCLMPNRYHLLVHTPDGNLSRCMRHINGVYTQRFNRAHKKDGQLFRGRFKAVVVGGDTYLLEVLRHIHNSPVRAGMVRSVDEFAWSSHPGYCSRASSWDWLYKDFLLARFSGKIAQARKEYVEFMQQPEPEEIGSFYGRKNLPSALGEEPFKAWLKEKFKQLRLNPEVPASKELAPGGGEIRALVCKTFEVEMATLMNSRRGRENIPRDVAIYLQRKYCGQTLKELGGDYGVANYSSVSSAVERAKSRLPKDGALKAKVSRLEKKIEKGQKQPFEGMHPLALADLGVPDAHGGRK